MMLQPPRQLTLVHVPEPRDGAVDLREGLAAFGLGPGLPLAVAARPAQDQLSHNMVSEVTDVTQHSLDR